MEIHNQGPTEELLLSCHGCGDGSHNVSFTMWKFKDGNYADIYVSDEFKYLRSSGIIGRINTLLNFIRRGNYCRGDVGLNKSQLIQIRDWCDKIINLSEHDDKEMLDL